MIPKMLLMPLIEVSDVKTDAAVYHGNLGLISTYELVSFLLRLFVPILKARR